MQGGIVFGSSTALRCPITLERGGVSAVFAAIGARILTLPIGSLVKG